jgi:hypothetical protein
MSAVDDVVGDLCHVLGINKTTIYKIEIFASHVEVWFYDDRRVLRFKYFPR